MLSVICLLLGYIAYSMTQARKKLARTRHELERAQEIGNIGNWSWELGSNQMFWSAQVFKIIGLNAEQEQASYDLFLEYVHDEDKDDVIEGFEEGLSNKKPFKLDFRINNAAGQEKNIEVSAETLLTRNNKIELLEGTFQDITQRMNLEGRIRQSRQLQAIARLAGGVAHHFNNLFAVMLGNAELLQNDLDKNNSKLQRFVGLLISNINTAANLNRQLLAFSRRQLLHPERVDVKEMLSRLSDEIQSLLGERIEFHVNMAPGTHYIMVDEKACESAITGIASNARDVLPSGGLFVIETSNVDIDETYSASHDDIEVGSYVRICLRDSGPGIDRVTIEKIFDPFFTTKDLGEGSGLGLSMVYGFMKQSDGHIVVDSTPGQGTSIQLYFPIAD